MQPSFSVWSLGKHSSLELRLHDSVTSFPVSQLFGLGDPHKKVGACGSLLSALVAWGSYM